MPILISLIALNLLTFLLFGLDKWKARRNGPRSHTKARTPHRRIPESTLLLLAALGGSLGAWLGMTVWHHKTLHLKFKYGVPALLLLHLLLLLYVSGLLPFTFTININH